MDVWSITLDPSSKVLLAKVLGYTSIGCWLCAQLPQVIKNATLKSCEGLALPFLVNWMFGDITNLVGCLLTDQLPFQTYLAAYFCIVDLALLAQFFHYRSTPTVATVPSPAPRYLSYNSLVASPHQSTIFPPHSAPPPLHPRTRSSSSTIMPPPPHTARPRPKRAHYTTTSSAHHLHPDINVTSPTVDGSYAAIYEAALDVARAAERASRRRSHSRARLMGSRHNSNTNASMTELVDGQDGGEEGMMESFHSDMSGRTSKSSTRASSPKSAAAARLTQSTGILLDLGGDRGRSRSRIRTDAVIVPTPPDETVEDVVDEIEGLPREGYGLGLYQGPTAVETREHQRSQSRSLSLARGSGGRGGRRAAGVAFMSLGLLVGSAGWNGSSASFGKIGGAASTSGTVLASPSNPILPRHPLPLTHHTSLSSSEIHHDSSPYLLLEFDNGGTGHDHDHGGETHPPDYEPNLERIIGRISAWSCTTLYLTSRLPQIWKNFQRKSVEGLSILLFLMAFLGNITYVASILLNPAGGADPGEASHYLLEALPYLLGSGGTLMFDLTIMIQSLIYGSSPPLPIVSTQSDRGSRRRHLSSRKRLRHLEDGGGGFTVSAERTPLLTSTGGQVVPTPHITDRALSPDTTKRATSKGRSSGDGITNGSPVRAALIV
ncbi:hypothetical protein CI109_100412 [Kwoniella shandongensis]|uniref:Uncharacterized protein n=1 Tax=Kwoniella shandongensis TaxID=1734106 RepID=A0A5M6C4A3_9TREE|nr:uncharacterized protein CI109_001743 [Kwoniella shandongensis]KAA5529803.1 hypothetical protein CI109_001743 [Kwoniella shandongensis]